MNRFLSACLVFCTLAAPLAHARQDRQENDRKEEVRRKISEMRKQLREGAHLKLNVQVLVGLKNGERIQGVVKEGRFVERPDGLDFAETDRMAKDSGIRIWYYDNTTSFIFLPYTAIKEYSIVRRLSDVEVKEIAEKMELEERKASDADSRRRAALAENQAKTQQERGLEEKLEKATSAEDELDAKKSQDARAAALLAEFPPDAGWGPAKLREIQVKKITVGVFPDERSKRFVDVYEEWKAAFDAGVEAAEKRAKEKIAEKGTGGEKG
jgi:hypothetical protein